METDPDGLRFIRGLPIIKFAIPKFHNPIGVFVPELAMGDHHDGAALAMKLVEVTKNLGGVAGIKIPGWFVGEDDGGAIQ